MGKIKKCTECNNYTLSGDCPSCGAEARDPAPPRFSVPDRYGEYRRQAKEEGNEDG